MTRPTLHTCRLTLVPLADEHLDFEVELDSDPEVLRYIVGHARTRAEVEQAHVGRMARADKEAGLGFWVGFLDDQFVGWWILEPAGGSDRYSAPSEAGLGYRLLRHWWRQGLASEGARELLRYGFDDVGLRRIFAQTMAVNAGSRAVMTSVGLSYVRTFDGGYDDPIPGHEHGEVEYAITRERWRTGHRA